MDYRLELVLWTAGSILLSVIAARLAWQAEHLDAERRRRSWLGLSFTSPGRVFLFLVRFAYYIGFPYAALMRHALSPVVIGLLGTQSSGLPWWMLGWNLADWAGALGWTIGLGGIAATTLVLGWWNTSRAMGGELPAGGLLPAPSIFVIVRESVYAEIHWAFYRAAPLAFIADPYWATLTGAALVAVEWMLDPSWRAGLANGSRREALLTQIAWLALSTCLFALAHNVWLIILPHVALAWAVGRWVALLAARTSGQPSASPASTSPR